MIEDSIGLGIRQTGSEYCKRTLNMAKKQKMKEKNTYDNIIMSAQFYELQNATDIFQG